MNEVLQWVIAGGCVLSAAIFLFVRFRKSARGECNKSCCDGCVKRSKCSDLH